MAIPWLAGILECSRRLNIGRRRWDEKWRHQKIQYGIVVESGAVFSRTAFESVSRGSYSVDLWGLTYPLVTKHP